MNFRLAKKEDLPQLRPFFKSVVKHMNSSGINIWNDYYPYDVLPEDIEENTLYLAEEEEEILAVFVLRGEKGEKNFVKWKEPNKKAMYIYRLAVNSRFLSKGIATKSLKFMQGLCKSANASYLRLLVVDINTPAINMYLKNGFSKVEGIYTQEVEKGKELKEFGFEKYIL